MYHSNTATCVAHGFALSVWRGFFEQNPGKNYEQCCKVEGDAE